MDKWLSNPTVIKVVAVILAIMLWMVVNMDDPPATADPVQSKSYTIKDVEITAKFDVDKYAVVQMTDKVTLELTGPASILNPASIPPDSYQIYVNAQSLGPGTYRLPVQFDGFPPNVFVTANPSFVEITLERKEQSQRTVHVEITGEPQDGYEAGQPVVSPSKVHVIAPERDMERIAQIRAIVNIQDANQSVNKTIPLQAIDAEGTVINATINPAIAEVNVPISSPFKELPIKLNLTGKPAAGYSISSIEQNVDNLTVYGPLDIIENMDFYPGPEVNLDGINMDRLFQLKIPLQEGIEKTEPEYVDILVHVTESAEKTLNNVQLSINGENHDLNAQFLDPAEGRISVNLKGSPENLGGLRREDIQAFVDASNLPPGEHQVPVQFNLPPYIQLAEEEPIEVTIKVLDGNNE